MTVKVLQDLSEEHFIKKPKLSRVLGVALTMLTPASKKSWNRYSAAHLLNRAGFGGTPDEIHALESKGLHEGVESLLHGDDDGDLFSPPLLIQPEERFAIAQKAKAAATEIERREIQNALRKRDQPSMLDLRLWWLNRMRYTSFPLLEKATLFWHGHFATSNLKVNDAYFMWQQNETLRHFALGKFPDLLKAMSRDPAMIRWLDLSSSRKGHPNENFAREVMELFSLGEGHYSEKDIQESARSFTGYHIYQETGSFRMGPYEYDSGQKTFLGKTGFLTGDDVIDMIVAQPQCARFIGKKLWVFFVADNPSDETVQKVADILLHNGYDIGATLGAIFRSAAFYSSSSINAQIKSPVQWLIQTTKMLEISLPDPRVVENSLAALGQVLFAPPNVKGWDGGRAWISSSSLLYRYNLAAYLLSGKAHILGGYGTKRGDIALSKIAPASQRNAPQPLLDQLIFRLFNTPGSKKENLEFLTYLQKHPTPYSDDVIRDLMQIMMGTPEFQLC
jgi:uncharacterized protein (DUF1800 family)